MVVLAIFVSVIAGTAMLSGTISHGMNGIKQQLFNIKEELAEINQNLNKIDTRCAISHGDSLFIAEKLESLRKILARNFRIAMNDEEFENL